jgi:hypothetical protein
MSDVDSAGVWRELSERYHQMSDTELVVLARQRSELTDLAQSALTQEISYRKLVIPPEETPVARIPEPDPNATGEDPYAEERKLIEIRKVWSLADALQIQAILERAGIPCFIGTEKATVVDLAMADYSNGLSVKIMQIGWYWAKQALKNYTPLNEPELEELVEPEEVLVRCPKCGSTEVVLGEFESDVPERDSDSPFEWACESCGHQWEDDGIVKEG